MAKKYKSPRLISEVRTMTIDQMVDGLLTEEGSAAVYRRGIREYMQKSRHFSLATCIRNTPYREVQNQTVQSLINQTIKKVPIAHSPLAVDTNWRKVDLRVAADLMLSVDCSFKDPRPISNGGARMKPERMLGFLQKISDSAMPIYWSDLSNGGRSEQGMFNMCVEVFGRCRRYEFSQTC